ncbi:GNAT family N-acetyltransferase [Ktedonosporobacter rubrisoli]|uniref:GNAT family N-acetyltransferase n=1 Tax=Ktedonosporobacter rubrisoli TaxID=2509675 RepID=A0A4P6JXG7_KTERU|nr:GNAT family N-acetyltransferase [Ktedonosporobacter rubrisoli]QBD80225.1 GNAT family N-acetyltransferase [Ktedonosporobacter rubrisoli]
MSLSFGLRDAKDRRNPPFLASVEDEHDGCLAVCMTPPRNLVIASVDGVDEEAASALIVADLHKHNWSVPGVLGPAQTAESFARAWQKQSGKPYREEMSHRVFELRQVLPPSRVPGHLQLAEEKDLELVDGWMQAFYQEALPKEKAESLAQEASARVAKREVYLWQLPTGQYVTMAAKTRPLAHGISISLVYTPPALRGKGYASNCVAALSELLLKSGWQWCSLFTDLSNPISNSIYQKIGYRPVCDFTEYLLY